MEIKKILVELDKTQVDLQKEMMKRPISKVYSISASTISQAIKGVDLSPRGKAIKQDAIKIIEGWKKSASHN